MTRFLIFILALSTISAAAAETRTWSGKWNNRKYGTSGPLKCIAQDDQPGRWSAVFNGTFKGDPFEYRVVFQAKSSRDGQILTGKATISGHPYEWNGTISDRQLKGSYRSTNGNNGTFVLRESVTRQSSNASHSATTARRRSSSLGTVQNGESFLFIGNSFMANEGGVFNYTAKALRVGAETKISTEKMIEYGRPLSAMAKPEVVRAIASEEYDSVVITSGQLATMKKFVTEINKAGKKPIVFMTWELRHPGNRGTQQSYTDATKRSVRDMRRLEKETGATIVPAAVVYHDLTTQPPEGLPRIDYLWRPANIHQNELGTMVNAWMFYAVLTGKSPVGVNFDMPPFVVGEKLREAPELRLTPELRRTLQERVWKVAKEWQSGKTHLE
ncbi:MAG: hypothetical protein ABJZ55_06075 [Fuerstiella sp.]